MKRFFILCLLFLFAIFSHEPPISAQVIKSETWVARYNGTGSDVDEANAITTDHLGNVYVTGSSMGTTSTGFDYATVKYDSNGNEIWVARYNGTSSYEDLAYAIATDGSGNIYVTGKSKGIGTQFDYATVKYDSNGNELWVTRYNGPDNGDDEAIAIAIDGSGNIYVTGTSKGSGTQLDYATVKYDSNGNELWVARYNGPDNYEDYAKGIVIDGSSNVYVTGSSRVSYHYDYVTVKYDSNGNKLWVARYNYLLNEVTSADDNASAIAIDNLGNVSVTGWSGNDYATVKYSSEGNEMWASRYDSPPSGECIDIAKAIAIDSLGNIFITGYNNCYYGAASTDYITVKYDPDGNELWVARYDRPDIYGGSYSDFPTALAVDSSDNVYVTGYNRDITGEDTYIYDYATIKYDSDGNALWVGLYSLPGQTGDLTKAITVDSLGNTFVTGRSGGAGTKADYATVKYSYVSLILRTPIGGEVIPSGSIYTIQWEAHQDAVKFTLTYSKDNGRTWNLIANNLTGTSYDWQEVPALLNNKKQCLIKVKAFDSQGVKIDKDKSDSVFTIEVVKLTSPDGGEVLTSGTPHTITWTTNTAKNPVSSVKLTYTANGGATWTLIDTPSGNPGSYNWTVPNVSSSSCKVKVVLKDSSGTAVGKDASDGFFTIQP